MFQNSICVNEKFLKIYFIKSDNTQKMQYQISVKNYNNLKEKLGRLFITTPNFNYFKSIICL